VVDDGFEFSCVETFDEVVIGLGDGGAVDVAMARPAAEVEFEGLELAVGEAFFPMVSGLVEHVDMRGDVWDVDAMDDGAVADGGDIEALSVVGDEDFGLCESIGGSLEDGGFLGIIAGEGLFDDDIVFAVEIAPADEEDGVSDEATGLDIEVGDSLGRGGG